MTAMLSKANLRLLTVFLFSGLAWGAPRRLPFAFVQASSLSSGQLHVTVMDQNGQPLSLVIVTVRQAEKTVAEERTTPTGTASLRQLPPGSYKVLLQKQGFYTTVVASLEITAGQTAPVEVRLQPVREYKEEVEVSAQPSPIDPEESASAQAITASDISNIPYPSVRDYRNVLPYIPGVLGDRGQIHIAGSSMQEIQSYMDGFEVSQPATGVLTIRLNPDSLRKIDVRSSRYSAQYGKGSGGLIDLQVQDGDNRFRVNVTDFVPTLQTLRGIHINNWTPRAYFSGPLLRDKIWFNVSHEGEINNNIIKELPEGADTNHIWRAADLGRLRMNLTQGNVLTGNALINMLDSQNSGITAFDPVSVSVHNHSYLYLLGLKDQITIAGSTLLEFGGGFQRSTNSSVPLGNLPYVLGPAGRSGNNFAASENVSTRTQVFSNLYLQPWHFLGGHQVSMGGRVDRVLFDGHVNRGTVQFLDSTLALVRQVTFVNVPGFNLSTVESSGYVQDRWSPVQRVILEPGARWDHDSYLQRDFYSPRIAGAVLLARESETKVSAGIGIYYDRTNLALASDGAQGTRTDVFFSPAAVSFPASFVADPRQLTMPRFVNWSATLERRLPAKFYARLEYLSRHGVHGWAFEPQGPGNFQLLANKKDRYDAAQITVRKDLKRGYPMVVSYTRSKSTSNRTIDFSIDALLQGNQVGGVLPWDSPNQLTTWGTYPLFWKFKKFDFAWSTLWHTGFPFATVDQFGQIVSGPGQFRFPDFFTANAAVERKFIFRGYRWAARIGMDDVTNRVNPTVVDNNINSPSFLTFFGTTHRTLNGRIRFLGKT